MRYEIRIQLQTDEDLQMPVGEDRPKDTVLLMRILSTIENFLSPTVVKKIELENLDNPIGVSGIVTQTGTTKAKTL